MSKSIKDYFTNLEKKTGTLGKKKESENKKEKLGNKKLGNKKEINFFRNYNFNPNNKIGTNKTKLTEDNKINHNNHSINTLPNKLNILSKGKDVIFKGKGKDEIFVYTDGACSANGTHKARAGIGIYFGDKDPRNVYKMVIGKQTNNTAELSAILECCRILDKELKEGIKINIVTDSKYSLLCCTTYGKKCYLNNWRNPNPKSKTSEIPNLGLVKQAYEISKYSNINFIKVEAHTGRQDKHSLGNEEADRLANLAIGRKPESNNKIYLSIPYENKDKIKHFGGKWDRKKKKWFIMRNLYEKKKKEIENLMI